MEAGRYRKRPVVIDAWQFTADDLQHVSAITAWCGGVWEFETSKDQRSLTPLIHIDTLEGRMTARPGDWIIRGVNGEFYPCKDDIFQKTYEPEVTT